MGMFHRPGAFIFRDVASLRRALREIPDDWEIFPNTQGNLALCEPGLTTDGQRETRWYVGYIDMATGDVHVQPGARKGDMPPGDPEQVPWKGDVIYLPSENRSATQGVAD